MDRRQIATVVARTGLLAAIFLFTALGFAQPASEGRLRLIPVVSDQRLEDIQESPTGNRLLTHDRGYAPRLWDPRSMRLLGVLPHTTGQVNQALMCVTGRVIGTVSSEEARLWDAASAHPLVVWTGADTQGEPFSRIALSADGSVAALGGLRGTVWIAKAPEYKLQKVAEAATSPIKDVTVSSDGAWIAACSDEAQILAAPVNGVPRIVAGPPEGALWVEFGPNNDQLLVTGQDNHAYLYGVPDLKEIKSWPHYIGDKGTIGNTLMAALFVGPGLEQILVAGADGVMSIFDRHTLQPVRELTGYSHSIREIRRTPDGLRVATYEDNDDESVYDPLKIWDVQTGKEFPFKRAGIAPTAGAFSPDGSVFWVGYDDGRIVRHRLADGEWASDTVGAVRAVSHIQFLGDTGWVALMPTDTYGDFRVSDSRKLDISEVYSTRELIIADSPNGKYAISPAYSKEGGDVTQAVWNISTGKVEWGFWESCAGATWSGPDGDVVAWGKNSAHLFKFPADEPYVRELFQSKLTINWIKASPDGELLLAYFDPVGDNPGEFGVVRIADGAVLCEFNIADFVHKDNVQFTSAAILVNAAADLTAYSTETGEMLWTSKPGLQPDGTFGQFASATSPDGSNLYLVSGKKFAALDPVSGKTKFELPVSDEGYREIKISPKGDLVAVYQMRELVLIDTTTQKIVATIRRNDTIHDVEFIPEKNRLLIIDSTDQLTIWDVAELRSGAQTEPLGSLVLMRGKAIEGSLEDPKDSWLVMDRDGRYDATDPNEVDGASYVLEWEGGLEPIDVQQLKSLFYEPGLFGKLVGYDPEPRRPVPPRDQIRLFPEIVLKRSGKNPDRIEVTLQDRDEGGIGKIKVLINGKQVEERSGSGYFVVDLAQYRTYMLPAAQLPPGHGNVVSIVASNKRGDLTSLPQSLDIGIPPDLNAPEVNLYGLFVGAGDYVGSRRDLTAPPYDAEALAEAIDKTGERFLPGRVHTTVLSTSEGHASPSREAILAWFQDVAQKATSSDIILVFMAGHGTSVIGDARGYFFLTAGADPGDVTPAILGVHTISAEDLQVALAKIPASKQVIVLDTCHSGAAASDLIDSRSVSSDYVRAYEAIKDGAGTWLLAGAAADQLSYESRSVDHGLLTYSLLEAIDQVSKEGLRATTSGEAFVNVERWFTYAAQRVESLRNEVGIDGVQRPEIKRSGVNNSFDIGVTRDSFRGELGLKPPMPIVLMGSFDEDEIDPLSLEPMLAKALAESTGFKLWQNVAKHPGAYRVAGQYVQADDTVKLRLFIQQFDKDSSRKNREVVEIEGLIKDMPGLVEKIKSAVDSAIRKLEQEKSGT